VPMFYFLVHFCLIHALTIPFAFLRYGRADFLPGFGYSLWVVYAVWISVVVALYPLCLWFARLKERRTDWWLSYL